MIKYLENRIWALNARIEKTDADAEEVNRQLETLVTKGIFAGGGIRFSYSENPIGNYSFRPVEVTLELTDKAVHLFQQWIDENDFVTLSNKIRKKINMIGCRRFHSDQNGGNGKSTKMPLQFLKTFPIHGC